MKKSQWGKLLYLFAILLVIYFGFLRPAMQMSEQPGSVQTETADRKTAEETDEKEPAEAETVQKATQEITGQELTEVAAEQKISEETAGQDIAKTATEQDTAEQSYEKDWEENSQEAVNIDSSAPAEIPKTDDAQTNMVSETTIDENGYYSSKNEVAFYLYTYGHLPANYITKDEAGELGWSKGNTLDEVAPGMSIGGDKFGNREGLLPKQEGRQYYECDIDYEKGGRNAKRIVYSNDGLIFYTEDHYQTFEQLY